MARKVAVAGWYGHGNLGDDMLLEGVRRLFKGWTVQVYSDNSYHKGVYPDVDVDRINGECDLFVLGGGQTIHRDRVLTYAPSRFAFNRLTTRAYAKTPWAKRRWMHRIKIPKIALGCGVNADHAYELDGNVVDELSGFSYIGLRDRRSLKILNYFHSLNGKTGFYPDPSLMLDVSKCSRENLAVVAPTDRPGLNIACKSAAWLNRQLRNVDGAIFVPFGSTDNNDLETCRHMSLYADNPVVLEQATFERAARLFSSCTHAVAYRLHAYLLSFMAGTECAVYPYHSKVLRVKQSMKGLGLEGARQLQLCGLNRALELAN